MKNNESKVVNYRVNKDIVSILPFTSHYGSSIEFKLCEFHYPDASFTDKHNVEKTHSLETFYYNLDGNISR